MVPTSAWRSAALAALAAAAFACKEQVTAPGHCPELCRADSLIVEDTVLTGVVVSDTSLRGFTRVDLSSILMASNLDSQSAYPLIRFAALPVKWFPSGVDTFGVTVGNVDSVTISLRLDMRDTTVHNLRLLLFHLPRTVDTLATYDSVSAVFAGAPFDSVVVDSLLRVQNLHQKLGVAGMTAPPIDSGVIAIGLAVRADAKTNVRLLSSDLSGAPPVLRYFVHGLAPRDTFTNVFALTPTFDTYVQSPDPQPPASQTLTIGNQPAARSFIRFNIPSYFVDSVNVVRASLQLTPTSAVRGIVGESASVAAQPILRYFDGKSILIQDTAAIGIGRIVAGQTTPVEIEIANLLRLWRGISPDSLPRAVALRNVSEDFTSVELQASGLLTGATAPRIRISFVRPFRFGVP